MPNDSGSAEPRRLFMVLSPRSLPYARLAIQTLYNNCSEDFELRLLTDSSQDKNELADELARLATKGRWTVDSFADLDEREYHFFGRYEHLRSFRRGHPCWRKITDPILLSQNQDEMIVLDPDIYFPNQFSFEPTLSDGVYLMWQRPSCLLPAEVVRAAIDAHIALAHHTDIGVAQWRLPIDLDWLEWLLQKLGSPDLPRSMHVESIVWAALAMRIGGGHLNRQQWLCWHRSQFKRVFLKLGVGGPSILSWEDFSNVKCFHAGGEAKWWLDAAHRSGLLEANQCINFSLGFDRFVEFKPVYHDLLQFRRRILRSVGYYSLLK